MTNIETLHEPGFSTIEIESDDNERLQLQASIPQGVSDVFVLMESDNRLYESEIIQDGPTTNDYLSFDSPVENQHQRVYIRNIPEGAEVETTIHASALVEKGTRSRILVVLFKRGFSALQEYLSCRACKKLVKTLISIVLSSFGLTVWPLDFDWRILPDYIQEIFDRFNHVVQNLAQGIADDLVDTPALKHLVDLLDNSLIQSIFTAMQDLLGVLEDILGIVDDVLTAICRRLEFCD